MIVILTSYGREILQNERRIFENQPPNKINMKEKKNKGTYENISLVLLTNRQIKVLTEPVSLLNQPFSWKKTDRIKCFRTGKYNKKLTASRGVINEGKRG